jgi:hypothetical protein
MRRGNLKKFKKEHRSNFAETHFSILPKENLYFRFAQQYQTRGGRL